MFSYIIIDISSQDVKSWYSFIWYRDSDAMHCKTITTHISTVGFSTKNMLKVLKQICQLRWCSLTVVESAVFLKMCENVKNRFGPGRISSQASEHMTICICGKVLVFKWLMKLWKVYIHHFEKKNIKKWNTLCRAYTLLYIRTYLQEKLELLRRIYASSNL